MCERLGVTRDYLRVLVHRAKLEFKTRYLARSERAVPTAAGSVPAVQQRKPGTR